MGPFTANELIALAKNGAVSDTVFEEAYLHYLPDGEYTSLLEVVLQHRKSLLARLGIDPAAAQATLMLLREIRSQMDSAS